MDSSRSRGVILDDDGVNVITTYGGGNLYTNVNAVPANLDGMYPDRNTDIPLGHPFSYRWFQGGRHFIPAGMERTADFNQPWSVAGVNVTTTGDEFSALRLAHQIEFPYRAMMTISGYSGTTVSRLPTSEDKFFTFPIGTRAIVLNADASSWASANPFISRNLLGLEVTMMSGGMVTVMTVQADNDGFREIDIGGKRVLHYMRSDSQRGQYAPTSAVPLHTNIWIRASGEAVLTNVDTGERIHLPENTLINPILGTYIHLLPSLLAEGLLDLSNNDLLGAVFSNAYSVPANPLNNIAVVRAALVLPVGTRVFVGHSGGEIENVKAAAFFSIAPLASVDCPFGLFDLANGQFPSGGLVNINQIYEGITEKAYEVATIYNEKMSLTHLCAWLDDPENTDGDYFYIYRGRRRYSDEAYKVRTLSNDRTYLLGGRLSLL